MARRSEIVERLAEVPLFARCTKRDLKIVARHAETIEVPSGVALVTEGEPGDSCFVLLSGSAVVEREGATVGALEPGGYFGELALLDPAPRAATVTVTEDAELAVLGVRMFRVLLRELPTLSGELLAHLASQVRALSAPR